MLTNASRLRKIQTRSSTRILEIHRALKMIERRWARPIISRRAIAEAIRMPSRGTEVNIILAHAVKLMKLGSMNHASEIEKEVVNRVVSEL